MLTEEDMLLGLTEPKKKTYAEEMLFTDACMYEVCAEGLNNKSIENGEIIKNILPLEVKAKFIAGDSEVSYNGMIIKKLTEVKAKEEPKEEIIEEPEEEKKEEEIKKPVKKAVKKTTKKK